jgi:hypothetical protein
MEKLHLGNQVVNRELKFAAYSNYNKFIRMIIVINLIPLLSTIPLYAPFCQASASIAAFTVVFLLNLACRYRIIGDHYTIHPSTIYRTQSYILIGCPLLFDIISGEATYGVVPHCATASSKYLYASFFHNGSNANKNSCRVLACLRVHHCNCFCLQILLMAIATIGAIGIGIGTAKHAFAASVVVCAVPSPGEGHESPQFSSPESQENANAFSFSTYRIVRQSSSSKIPSFLLNSIVSINRFYCRFSIGSNLAVNASFSLSRSLIASFSCSNSSTLLCM